MPAEAPTSPLPSKECIDPEHVTSESASASAEICNAAVGINIDESQADDYSPSKSGSANAIADDESELSIAVVQAIPYLAGTEIVEIIEQSLQGGELPTEDDNTFRAPALELMRLFDLNKTGKLKGQELDTMLLTFARSSLPGEDDPDYTPAEVEEAVATLRQQLESAALSQSHKHEEGITVDDLEIWLEQMDEADDDKDDPVGS